MTSVLLDAIFILIGAVLAASIFYLGVSDLNEED